MAWQTITTKELIDSGGYGTVFGYVDFQYNDTSTGNSISCRFNIRARSGYTFSVQFQNFTVNGTNYGNIGEKTQNSGVIWGPTNLPSGSRSFSWTNPWYNGTTDVTGSGTVPTLYTKPTKPTISVVNVSTTSNKITYGTTSFGTGTGSNHVYLYGGTSSTPTNQIASKTSTGNSDYTNSSLTPGTTYYYRALASNGGLNSDYSSTVSIKTYQVPATPTVTKGTVTDSAITVSYGTTTFNNPSSGTVYLYGGTTASPTTQKASKTSTGNSNYTWSSLVANTRYYFRAKATNTGGSSNYSSDLQIITLPPTPSALSVSSSSYTAYNKCTTTFSYTIPSAGSAATKTGYYRISTNGGSSYGSWTSFGTVSSNSGTFSVANLATSTSTIIQIKLTTSAGDSGAKSLTFTTKTTHTAPNFSDFTYQDSNASTVALTGDNQTMIQSQSTPEITISTSNKATGNDGIAVSTYSFNFSGQTDSAAWSSSSAVVKTLGTPQNSGTQAMKVTATDALSLTKAVSKNVTVYPWSAPTISATAQRENNFENDTTLSISGTWAPITISSVDKNTITVEYRYRESSSSSWTQNWTTRPTTTSGGNWGTTDLVIQLDNTKQWVIEIRATDEFTSESTSLTVPVGIPIFFIGSDGRVGIGAKPSESILPNDNGLLEVNGRIVATGPTPNGSGKILIKNSIPSTDTMIQCTRTDVNKTVRFGVGSSGVNHGIFSDVFNKWMIYGDASHIYVNDVPISDDYVKYYAYTSYKATNITTSSINLNSGTYCKVGKYVCTNGSTGASQSNNPSGTAYQMWVININSDTLDPNGGAWKYMARLMLAINGMWYQNCNTNASGTWTFGAWRQLHN